MTGMFELFTDSDTSYRFRLTAPDGTVMALSKPFPDLPAAVAGIAAVREYAGMGLVTEIPAPQDDAQLQAVAETIPVAGVQVDGAREAHANGVRARVRPARDGAPRSPEGPPRLRIPSGARFLGGRAVARNRQLIVRWRQALEARTAQVGLSSC
jgi:uncharacterized protein YegP (UPF0339 family)